MKLSFLSLFSFLLTISTTGFSKDFKKKSLRATDTLVQFIPSTVGPYCPKLLLGGDRDFGGNGPEIYAWIKLHIVNKRTIEAEIFMHARETKSDWSETRGTWKKTLYTAPNGFEIVEIVSGKYSEVKYVSRPGVKAFTPTGLLQALGGGAKGTDAQFKDDGLVTRWNIVGDTGGDDISTDDNCNDDTQVAIQLNPMKILLTPTSLKKVVVTPPARSKQEVIVVKEPSDITTIQLKDITEQMCPKNLIRGDREFDGNGPKISCEVRLKVDADKKNIYAHIYFTAQETKGDWSTAKGEWKKLVYTAPPGKMISAILSDNYSITKFISPAAGFQFLAPGADVSKVLYTFLDNTDIKSAVLKAFGYGPNEKSALSAFVKGTIDNGNTVITVPSVDGALVKFFHIVGDTGGPDISTDDNCNDDTRINKIEFFPLKVKLKTIK